MLKRGEILGIAGLVGSGRTELLRAILGLDRLKSGVVVKQAPRGIGLLSEDRGGEGLMLNRSIAENIELSPRGPLFVDPRAVRAEGARWIAELAVKTSGPDQRVGDLRGQRRDVVVVDDRPVRDDEQRLLRPGGEVAFEQRVKRGGFGPAIHRDRIGEGFQRGPRGARRDVGIDLGTLCFGTEFR